MNPLAGMKHAVMWTIRHLGYEIVPADAPPVFPFTPKQFEVAKTLDEHGLLPLLPEARAKDGQDLLAASLFGHGGVFVDVGAYDGVHKSNTYLLEKELGWTGVVIEPNPKFRCALEEARGVSVETRAVTDTCGRTVGLLIDDQRTRVIERPLAASPDSVHVETVCLGHLLEEHDLPQHIDYLSVDVEGKELEVLRGFPFDERTLGLVTVEHNFSTHERTEVRELLESEGYVQILADLSRNEDWFVHPRHAARFAA